VGKTSEFYAAIPKEIPDRITVLGCGASVAAVISGTKSAAGSWYVQTMLTVIESRREQERDVFAFVTQAIESHFAHRPAPSLLHGV